jgi:hypothetical protein
LRLSGALPLRYCSGQLDTPRSNTPVAASNSGVEHQLAVRRGRRTVFPAHVHAPAQGIHHLLTTRAIGDCELPALA